MEGHRRILAVVMIAALALSVIAPFSSAVVVKASTGHPMLAAVGPSLGYIEWIRIANFNISVPAGSMNVYAVDGEEVTGYFAIVFYAEDSWLVTFSGAQFDLYMSKDGYSHISPGDKAYATGFSVADLDATPLKKVTVKNPNLKEGKADFYIGKVTIDNTVYKILVGPIMFDDVTPEYKFIKIFDGDMTSVAVAVQTVIVLPALELTPTKGPGGALVTLKGVALKPNELLNLTYGGSGPNDKVFAQVRTDAIGKFTYSWNIKDLKREFEHVGPNPTSIPYDEVNVYVWYNKTGRPVAPYGLHYVTYEEYYRAFWQFKSVKAGALLGPPTSEYLGWGNATDTTYTVVDVYVFDTLIVAGVWWNPTSPVTFVVDGRAWGSVTPNATGFFNVSLTVPELPKGEHLVKVYNADVRYEFKINVLPTLVLIPEEGTVGTVVRAKAYGFPPNELIGIWWYEKAKGEDKWYNLVNGTTGPDGTFNVTVTFTVPRAYGGDHDVAAADFWPYGGTGEITKTTFKVLPKLEVVPPVIKNDGSLVKAVGTGFDPDMFYAPNIDNQFLAASLYYDSYYPIGVGANETGDLVMCFVAAGFRPGLHVLSLYPAAEKSPYKPASYALFTVTVEGDPIVEFLKSINATVVEVKDGMATVLAGQERLQVSLEAINAKLVSIEGDIATIKTDLGTVKTSLDAINAKLVSIEGDIATIKTDLGAIKGTVTSISEGVATIKTDLGTVKAAIPGVKAAADALFVPVWVAAAFAIIATILAIVSIVLIQRKIAK
jgi:hypothetical protein